MQIIVPPLIKRACEILSSSGFQAYLVGGAVRDSLLGLKPTDWDITTDAAPEQIQNIFDRTIPTGKEFGTITVLLEGAAIEITTMRRDGPYSDGRHPDYVTLTDQLQDDLGRRDFTINALAYEPQTKRIIDPYFGRKHLRRKILVTVGDPASRFQEDPLRMLRLVRFQSTLGFRIEKKTRLTLPGLARLITNVSPERIFTELNKTLLGRELFQGLQTLYTGGLMEQILPELSAGHQVSPGSSHPYDLLGHAMTAAHFAPPVLQLRWAALLHDVGKIKTLGREHAQISAQWAERILKRLRADNQLVQKVSTLITHHMFGIHPHSSDKEIRRFLAQVGYETAFELVKLRQADMAGMDVGPRRIIALGQSLEARFNDILGQEQALSIKDLCVDGNDLMEFLRLEPGPLVGAILQYLLDRVLDEPALNQPEQLLELARKYRETLPQNEN